MALLPDKPEPPTVTALLKVRGKTREQRLEKLDVATLSHPCRRFAWNVLRWIGEPWMEPATGYAFPIGQADEIELLGQIQQIVTDLHMQADRKPMEFLSAAGRSHVRAFMPAAAIGFPEAPKTWHVVLIDFVSEADLHAIQQSGAAIAARGQYLRAQYLMKATDMERAILIVNGIDSNTLWAERIHFDANEAANLELDIAGLVNATDPPPKIGDSKHATCAGCQFNTVCHGRHFPVVTCRGCVHSEPIDAGLWRCKAKKRQLTYTEQIEACEQHLFIPLSVNASMIGFGAEFVHYKKDDGTTFVNADHPEAYESKELARLTLDMAANPTIDKLKVSLSATVTEVSPPQNETREQWVKRMADAAARTYATAKQGGPANAT